MLFLSLSSQSGALNNAKGPLCCKEASVSWVMTATMLSGDLNRETDAFELPVHILRGHWNLDSQLIQIDTSTEVNSSSLAHLGLCPCYHETQ